MEEKVAEQMRLMRVEKQYEGNDFYRQMVESMSEYFEKLTEFYNQVMIMRLESVKTKLDYLKCQQDLQGISRSLESCQDELSDF